MRRASSNDSLGAVCVNTIGWWGGFLVLELTDRSEWSEELDQSVGFGSGPLLNHAQYMFCFSWSVVCFSLHLTLLEREKHPLSLFLSRASNLLLLPCTSAECPPSSRYIGSSKTMRWKCVGPLEEGRGIAQVPLTTPAFPPKCRAAKMWCCQ